MSARRFPTDAEVDQWMREHIAPLDDIAKIKGTHYADQLAAAVDEVDRNVRVGFGPYAAMSGWSDSTHRGAARVLVRALLAAQSVGVQRMCDHVDEIKPAILSCDPPFVVCRDCVSRVHFERLRLLFDGECDSCGKSEPIRSTLATFGFMYLHLHVCDDCHAAAQGRRVLYLGPDLQEGSIGLRLRDEADRTDRCPACDSEVEFVRDPEFPNITHRMMYHDDGCPVLATNSAIDRQLNERARRGRKIGRNEPCFCGSGVKFKKCCGKAKPRPHGGQGRGSE